MSARLCLPVSTASLPIEPTVDTLSYSLGLPGGAYCAGLARATVRRLLQDHDLGDVAPLAELVTSELLACAYRFTPERDVSFSLRCRYEVLRVTVFDQHRTHKPRAGAACRERRLRSMSLLAAVAERCGGEFGIADAESPLTGARSWAAFPLEGASRYALL